MQKGRGHLGLSKPPAAPPRNAGADARKEYEGAIEKWEIRNDIAYYATYSSAKYDASAKEVADTYHKECVDGDPPREPRAHELMERLVNRFALDKQKTTESVQTKYNDWKIDSGEDPMSAVDRLRKIILRLKNLGQEQTELSKITS